MTSYPATVSAVRSTKACSRESVRIIMRIPRLAQRQRVEASVQP